jgi:hypothetical protein
MLVVGIHDTVFTKEAGNEVNKNEKGISTTFSQTQRGKAEEGLAR